MAMSHATTVSAPMEGRSWTVGRLAEYTVYIIIAIATLGPFLWVVLLSFKTRREFANDPFGLPLSLHLDNYVAVFERNGVMTFFFNSVLVSAAALAVLLVASVLAAYAIARVPFRGRNVVFVMFLLGDAIPLVIVIIPLFVLIQRIGLGNNILALVFSYVAMNVGVAVFILRGFFRSIHADLIDAAKLDGCSALQTILHIMLPMARPALIVVAVTNFISFWNEYFLASILMSTQ